MLQSTAYAEEAVSAILAGRRPPAAGYKSVAFSIRTDDATRLDAIAERLGVSRQLLVRTLALEALTALEQRLGGQLPPGAEPPTALATPTRSAKKTRRGKA